VERLRLAMRWYCIARRRISKRMPRSPKNYKVKPQKIPQDVDAETTTDRRKDSKRVESTLLGVCTKFKENLSTKLRHKPKNRPGVGIKEGVTSKTLGGGQRAGPKKKKKKATDVPAETAQRGGIEKDELPFVGSGESLN